MATYPSVYRARAVKYEAPVLTAFVPQVFGNIAIEITEVIGAPTQGMGWVFFQGGNPEFPVWNGGVGGSVSDVVWLGPDAPTDKSIELWWDTDEEAPLDPRYLTQAIADPLYLSQAEGDARYATPGYVDARATDAIAWTPAITTSGTAFNRGTTGTSVGWYTQAGDLVTAQFVVTCAGTGITKGTGTLSISLPVPPIALSGSSIIIKGFCSVSDNAVGVRTFGIIVTGTNMQLVPINFTYVAAATITEATLGITTLAAGDVFAGQVTYQAA